MSEKVKYSPQELLNEIEYCREEIVKNPENINLYLQLAHFLELNDNLPEAIQTYQAITQKEPQHKKAYYRLGLCYNKSGFKNRAIDSLEAVLTIEPENLEVWCNLGYIYWEINDLNKAKLCYFKAYKLDAKNNKVLQSLSLLYYLLEDYQKALDLAKELEQISSEKNNERAMHLAMCYVAVKEYKKANLLYEKILNENLENSTFLNNYANCLKALKQFQKAEEYYLKSLEKEQKNPNFHFNYGQFLYEQGKKELSISHFQEVLRQDPEDIESLQYLAKLFEEKNPKEALKIYKKILTINPSNINALYTIANIQDRFEMYKESTRNRQKVYTIKKNHWENNLKLSQVFFKTKKITEGWGMLKFNPLITKEHLPLLEQISQSFQYHKNYLAEIDVLQLIVKLDKKNCQSWARLAEIILKNKDITRAYKYALQSSSFLKSDVLFTGRLTQQLIKANKIDEAIEISHYLIDTAEIDSYLLSAILKNFQEKNLLNQWLQSSKEIIKKKENLQNTLQEIFQEMGEENKLEFIKTSNKTNDLKKTYG